MSAHKLSKRGFGYESFSFIISDDELISLLESCPRHLKLDPVMQCPEKKINLNENASIAISSQRYQQSNNTPQVFHFAKQPAFKTPQALLLQRRIQSTQEISEPNLKVSKVLVVSNRHRPSRTRTIA
jgi:hypothetical protein